MIIALDSAPNNLIREWLFENANCRNEIGLIAVRKYRLNSDEMLIVPYHIISYDAKRIRNPKGARQIFVDVIEEFKKLDIPGISLGKIMATNCAVYISETSQSPKWPEKVHYEFTDWIIDENRIGIEIMAKLKSHPKMKEPILSLKKHIHELFPNNPINVLGDNKSSKGEYKGWTRLQVSVNGDQSPNDIASIMCILINRTRSILTDQLIMMGYIQ